MISFGNSIIQLFLVNKTNSCIFEDLETGQKFSASDKNILQTHIKRSEKSVILLKIDINIIIYKCFNAIQISQLLKKKPF